MFDAITSLATVGALLAAIWQLHIGNRDRRAAEQSTRADRAMRLFEEVVAGGDTAKAFHELSVYLRHLGSDRSGTVTWRLPTDDDLHEGGAFAPVPGPTEQAFANLYTIMWYFERAKVSIDSNVVDRNATFETLGFHFWWWGQILRSLNAPKAKAALSHLSEWAEQEAARRGILDDWSARCSTDFDAGPPVSFVREATAKETHA